MAGFSIEEFKAVVNSNDGFAKPNRFFVSFTQPLGIAGQTVRNNVEYYCEATNLPGAMLHLGETRRYTYGPSEKRPFGVHFNPIQMLIMADGNGRLWEFFNDWMNYIMPHAIGGGTHVPVPGEIAGSGTAYPYELAYKQDYVTDIMITHLHEKGKPTARTICRDCFPSQVSDISLSWADNNNIARFQVQMEYLEWTNISNVAS